MQAGRGPYDSFKDKPCTQYNFSAILQPISNTDSAVPLDISPKLSLHVETLVRAGWNRYFRKPGLQFDNPAGGRFNLRLPIDHEKVNSYQPATL